MYLFFLVLFLAIALPIVIAVLTADTAVAFLAVLVGC